MAAAILVFASCSSQDRAESAVADYMQENLKNLSYESIRFSKLDTLQSPDTSDDKRVGFYLITHDYTVENRERGKKEISVEFPGQRSESN